MSRVLTCPSGHERKIPEDWDRDTASCNYCDHVFRLRRPPPPAPRPPAPLVRAKPRPQAVAPPPPPPPKPLPILTCPACKAQGTAEYRSQTTAAGWIAAFFIGITCIGLPLAIFVPFAMSESLMHCRTCGAQIAKG